MKMAGFMDESLQSSVLEDEEYLIDIMDETKLERRYMDLDIPKAQKLVINDYIACVRTAGIRHSELLYVEGGHPPDFPKSRSYGILLSKKAVHMNPNTEKLRKKYMDNPPEGMTFEDIRHMCGDDLLDMDYFLNEDDPFEDDFGEEGFYIF